VRSRVEKLAPWALAALALVLGAGAQAVAARHGANTTYAGSAAWLAALELAAAWSLVAAGLLVWRGRPRVGALAVAAGVAWLAPDFVGWVTGPPGVRSVALLLPGVTLAAAVHLVAGAPTGRVTSWPARALVAAAYAELVVVATGRALVRDPFEDPDCWSNCATNVLLVLRDRDLARLLTEADLVFAIAIAVAVVALGGARLIAARPAARRTLGPVLGAGAAFAALQAGWAAALLRTPLEDPDRPVFANLFATRSAALIALAAALAWTVVRAAGARAAVARIVDDLRAAPAPLDLQGALARALGDPGLTVAYRIADDGRYADANGVPVQPPAPGGRRAVTSIERDGEPVALVLHDPAALSGPDLAREIGAAARLAVDNERLQAQSRAQLAELRASRTRIVETADAARRRLERNLHDGAQQRLISVSLMLHLAGDCLAPATGARIAAAESELRAAVVELRELAHGIHPVALSEEGLGPAIRALADDVPLSISALDLPASRLPPAVETAAYLLVDEVARSSAQTDVALRAEGGALHVELTADGGALQVELTADGGPATTLAHARDRIGALEGELVARAGRVSASIPLA
jgi:signal transduction histidine kinase